MSSLFRKLLLLTLAAPAIAHAQNPLRICADPDNLPFSNRSAAGFDNRIADLLSRSIGRQPVFVWARVRRGFMRERFNRGECDVLMGVPEGMHRVGHTIPYYRSSYVFVTRKRDHMQLAHFYDSAIGSKRIGLQMLEEDYSPPSLPLIRYGHATQLVGFSPFGDGAQQIIRAVATQQVCLAVVWGPVAGFFAGRQQTPLTITPVDPAVEAGVPFRYDLTIAVHTGDTRLAEELNRAIRAKSSTIRQILHDYHVPEFPADGGAS